MIANIKVENCARCKCKHEGITLEQLDNPREYTHFYICPTKKQPVLIKLLSNRDDKCGTPV